MLRRNAGFVICMLAGAPTFVLAAEEAIGPFACKFDQGASWTYDAGKFQSTPPATLGFEIDQIDLEGQKARLIIDGQPTGALRVIRALNANHYLEVANEGFLNLTTIYDLDPGARSYPAVHSRHFGILGQPVFAQYAGSCIVKAAK
ncbi:MAG: hypothetical protein ACT4OU_10635 [Hyphomicrobium sp.]